MAMVTLGDVFTQGSVVELDVIQSFMDENGDRVNDTPFFQSGILVSNLLVEAAAASPTAEVTIPYMGRLDSSVEPNYSNDVYEDVAIPHKLDHGFMKARNAFLNEGWGAMDLVQELTGKDPLAYVAARLGKFWAEQAENRIVATARGIYELEAANADMNVTAAVADSIVDTLIDAQLTLGDAFGNIDGYIMDSKTFARAAKEKLALTTRDPETSILTKTLNGLPVIVSDRAMVNGDGESVITLLGRGSFAYGMANPRVPLAYEREEARGNGGGAETLWTRRNMIVHPMGYNFLSAHITGNGTETVARSAGWADLINPANWERAVDRKGIPLAFVTVANT